MPGSAMSDMASDLTTRMAVLTPCAPVLADIIPKSLADWHREMARRQIGARAAFGLNVSVICEKEMIIARPLLAASCGGNPSHVQRGQLVRGIGASR